jgi:hypothetical protein
MYDPLNLQNLHPRFKSGRRLHFPEQNRSFPFREGKRTLSKWDYGGPQMRELSTRPRP